MSQDGQTLAAPAEDEESRPYVGRFNARLLTTPFQFLGFWSAVVLPFLHVPLLVTGLSTPAETFTFIGLFALNLVAIVVGHSYNIE